MTQGITNEIVPHCMLVEDEHVTFIFSKDYKCHSDTAVGKEWAGYQEVGSTQIYMCIILFFKLVVPFCRLGKIECCQHKYSICMIYCYNMCPPQWVT
jgi:hypothetical protein